MDTRISVDAHPRYLLSLTRPPSPSPQSSSCSSPGFVSFLSPLAVVILIFCLAIGFGFDILIWFLKGIRSIELDDESLTVYRGPSLEMQRIKRADGDRGQRPQPSGQAGRGDPAGPERHALWIAEDSFPKEPFAALSHRPRRMGR